VLLVETQIRVQHPSLGTAEFAKIHLYIMLYYKESIVFIRHKAFPYKKGATRTPAHRSRPMAKRNNASSSTAFSGNKKHLFFGGACLCCVATGAYIGYSSQEDSFLADGHPSMASESTPEAKVELELQYAYFGAAPITMPSERFKNTISATPVQGIATEKVVATTSPLTETTLQAAEVIAVKATSLHSDPIFNTPLTPSNVRIATVKKGDTFSTIGQEFGLSARQAANIMRDKQAAQHLSTILPGQQITFTYAEDNPETLQQVMYVIDEAATLTLDRLDDASFVAVLDQATLERRTISKMGIVDSSLFVSAKNAGVSNRHIMQMVEIFRWDVDFAMEVRQNDTFKVIYDAYYKDEQLVRTGKLLGVEFNGRSRHQALYFENSDGEGGYYTPRGHQLEKQFLRNPVDTVRITSKFNLKRMHPVLNTIRAHKGVDYGAAIGTPIKATADGTVKYSGRRGSYGLTVELQHGKKYSTLYAHMNKIHPSSGVGKKVKQGQVIGYVGKTGRVTGAHLHYEFRVNGVHVNPLTVKFAGAGELPTESMRQFKTATAPIMQMLNNAQPSSLALMQ